MSEKIICGDALDVLKTLDSESVDCCITSPPYWGLRDYGVEGQLGLEKSPEDFVNKLVAIFKEAKRVLKNEGTLWLNLGDSYNSTPIGRQVDPKRLTSNGEYSYDFKKPFWDGLPAKNLIGIPWRVAFALQADGWYLRQDIIWAKPNPMPESVTDRCTKSHEYIFLLSKSPKYYFDNEAIQERATGYDGRKDTMMKGSEKYADGNYLAGGNANSLSIKGRERWKWHKSAITPGQTPHTKALKRMDGEKDPQYPIRNRRSVWTVNTMPYKEAHFATFPEKLIEPMILAGCPKGGTVLDPFSGAGTTGVVAKKFGRNYIGIELNPEYVKMSEKRINALTPPMF